MMNDALGQRLLAAFEQAFGGRPDGVVQAPGRVNLIGEHTDYNQGFVLPCAIGFQTRVALRRRADAQVRVHAADAAVAATAGPGSADDAFGVGGPIGHAPAGGWADYVRGVFELLRRQGVPLAGVDCAIAGDVPQGAGLSSSASLQVALALGLRELLGIDGLDAVGVAQLAQAAENDFVGVPCGIMDQLASACGSAGHALLIDCQDLQIRPVPVPSGLAVMVVHSQVQRGLVDSAYRERRAQCAEAARRLGLASLRQAESLPREAHLQADLRADPVWRRARHVIGENARTLAAARALAAGDLQAVGRLMAESHASMRDDFEITVPAIDRLVAILQAVIGTEGGARMTGGGFGGCVVALLPPARIAAAREALARDYRSPQGLPALAWVTEPAAGAGRL